MTSSSLINNFLSKIVAILLSSDLTCFQLSLPIHLTALLSQPIHGLICLPTGSRIKMEKISKLKL